MGRPWPSHTADVTECPRGDQGCNIIQSQQDSKEEGFKMRSSGGRCVFKLERKAYRIIQNPSWWLCQGFDLLIEIIYHPNDEPQAVSLGCVE